MKFTALLGVLTFCIVTSAHAFEPDWIRDWPSQSSVSAPRQSTIITESNGQITNHSTSDAGVRLILADLRRIRASSPEDQKQAAEWIVEHQIDLPPPYLYEAARQLLATDHQAAANIYFLARTRSQYDALKCRDRSAPQGIAFFHHDMPDFGRAFQGDRKTIRNALSSLLERDDFLTHQASAWWICSHGILNSVAASSGNHIALKDWRVPETEWDALKQRIRVSVETGVAQLSE